MASRRADDDSGEEEATAIDLRSTSQAIPRPVPARPLPVVRAPVKAASIALHSEEEDEEATEFLAVRPPSARASAVDEHATSSPSLPSLRARGRAVPLEGAPAADPAEEATNETGTDEIDATDKIKVEEADRAAALLRHEHEKAVDRRGSREPAGESSGPGLPSLPQRTPRPLPSRALDPTGETLTGQPGARAASSASARTGPRITRIVVPSDGAHQRIGGDDSAAVTDPGDDDEATDPRPAAAKKADAGREPPRGRAAPSGDAKRSDDRRPDDKRSDDKRPDDKRADDKRKAEPQGRARPHPRTERVELPARSETLEAEPADGTLIVEVPEGAVVFVNGLERGVGPSLKVTEIDRYAKHSVRIHSPGFLPWSGSVCLEGRTAAKVRPSLKKRDR
jgi:hypothetical protein